MKYPPSGNLQLITCQNCPWLQDHNHPWTCHHVKAPHPYIVNNEFSIPKECPLWDNPTELTVEISHILRLYTH